MRKTGPAGLSDLLAAAPSNDCYLLKLAVALQLENDPNQPICDNRSSIGDRRSRPKRTFLPGTTVDGSRPRAALGDQIDTGGERLNPPDGATGGRHQGTKSPRSSPLRGPQAGGWSQFDRPVKSR
jgi:hypothetical protein